MTFIFSRIIHVNFNDCFWSNRLRLERIIKNYHNIYSNTQTIVLTVIGYNFKFENSISIFQLMIEALLWIFKQLKWILFCTFMKKTVKLMKITYTAYQCWLFCSSVYLYFDSYWLHSQRVKLHAWWVHWSVDITWQCSFTFDGTCTCIIGWPSD